MPVKSEYYSHYEILQLRIRLPYGCFKELAQELGYVSTYSVTYLFDTPRKWTKELYEQVESFIFNYSANSDKRLGKIVDKDAPFCYESAKAYLNGLESLILSDEYKRLTIFRRDRIIEEAQKIKRQIEWRKQTIYLNEN